MNALSREHLLDAFVSSVRDEYDYILIDCSPSLNLVTINVLTTADSVIIPVEASYLSMAGLQQLLASIGSTKRKLNRNLEVEGIVINKVNTRTKGSTAGGAGTIGGTAAHRGRRTKTQGERGTPITSGETCGKESDSSCE